ncbi:MAG: adenine deaminase, partial [Marinilabiliales bacterium]
MNIIKGNIVDVVSSRIFKGEIHYHNGVITSIIEKEVQEDQYILPGLINAHVHIESTMLSPLEYSKEAVKHGTVAAVCDPHEIANVLGVYGVDYMIENGKSSPFKFFFGAPSCVPATPFETSGFELNAEVIKSLLKSNEIHFLAEMMNYPGVVYNDKEVMEKVNAGIWYKKPIDGHAPGLKGADLKKYAEAGITTDHECVNMEEATAKLNAGIKVQIREGSAAKNLEALYKLIDLHPGKIMLCTDDSHPDDLINGHINIIVKRCLELGCDFLNTLKAATIV